MTQDLLDGPVRPASTLLLLRDDPAFEVLMVERHHAIDFAGGALVFPGGKTHAGDHHESWGEHALGWGAHGIVQAGLRIAAIRELFEEAGLLLARRADGRPLEIEPAPLALRQSVDRGETPFIDVVRAAGVQLDLSALTVFARWITPPVTPKRFDTWFYLAHAPADQLAVCDGRETVDACWYAPEAALGAAERGERKVVFPTRMNLGRLARSTSAATAIAEAETRPVVTVQPEIHDGPDGRRLVLPEAAGYGAVSEPFLPGM
ncbi:MAG: NUDIX domain-containing protein [Phenylobacterium sp.]|uniref:NUDIX hydrolase n=1 Tax=Phenylobacterium sp. TaxID=1871053 RepID=UPI0025E966E9|nr:NUDIX domain-containing protein [Phenylobacterium sp.]MCG9916070.1 NUDIX domain-containing protein [Phenylobacterium sp.]